MGVTTDFVTFGSNSCYEIRVSQSYLANNEERGQDFVFIKDLQKLERRLLDQIMTTVCPFPNEQWMKPIFHIHDECLKHQALFRVPWGRGGTVR
jgi:hypothetical protein